MIKHFLDIIVYLGTWYIFLIDVTYVIFKYIKRDTRFTFVSLWKYLQYPIKTFRGEL